MKKLLIPLVLILLVAWAPRPVTVLPYCGPFIASAPISRSGMSNFTISGDSIGTGTYNISLYNCTNVHITKCKLQNASVYGIYLDHCTNVTIDSCLVINGQSNIHAQFCASIKVNNNRLLNPQGPFPKGNFVQFQNNTGGGQQINGNKCWVKPGQAAHPQDGLSVYQSDGLPGDSIQVIGNWILGGQVLHDSGGAAGIVLGDVGGSYQVARYNILVNPGSVGAQVQGGSHIKMDHNTIYSSATTYSVVGIAYGNYSGAASTDITMSYNTIKFIQTSGSELDEWWDPSTVSGAPIGWGTNITHAAISSSILPSLLWGSCTVSVLSPVISYASTLSASYGTAIAAFSPLVSGGAPTIWAVSPALPAGLSLNTTTGAISGTPTAISSTASYTVTGTNSSGSSTASISITVNPADLVISADNKTKFVGAVNPALTLSYSGFKFSDGLSSLSTAATVSTTATTTSAAGDYYIVPTGASATNYSITYVDGVLKVSAGLGIKHHYVLIPNP